MTRDYSTSTNNDVLRQLKILDDSGISTNVNITLSNNTAA
ncbi:hypothetical protein VCHENC02_3588 [Vibrio harveyi]|uniref:Uncharacterized protein n=1 Tax=Vibrio harveyi TaxID=669 RepID=A0A454CWD0_VIBHA|nr:hypothetical protein VCHENC02_3588 [Vibrio harveyi]